MSPAITKLSPSLNAYLFQFDESLLIPLRNIYVSLISPILTNNPDLLTEGESIKAPIHFPDYRFFVTSYGKAPLFWISNDDYATYHLFNLFFEQLAIAEEVKNMIDYDKNIIMYCGFFVVGNYLNQPLWHVDYYEGANAFTLITPLINLDPRHGRLLYANEHRICQRYEYKMGEAIFFGDGFSHSTEPYQKTNTRVLLSLTFGTDKTKYWEVLERTIGKQSRFMILPCGHQAGTCECVVLQCPANYVSGN